MAVQHVNSRSPHARKVVARGSFAALALLALLSVEALADPSATASAAPPDAVDAKAAAAPGPAVADAAAAEQARLKALAKRYGYTMVEKDGNTLFCKEQGVTASRVRKQKRCVDEDQMELEAQNASDILDKVNRGFTPNSPP